MLEILSMVLPKLRMVSRLYGNRSFNLYIAVIFPWVLLNCNVYTYIHTYTHNGKENKHIDIIHIFVLYEANDWSWY